MDVMAGRYPDLSTMMALAPNPNSNHANVPTNASLKVSLVVVGISLGLTSFICIALLLWADFIHTRRLLLDELLCFFAWILTMALLGISVSQAKAGDARHDWEVPLSSIDQSYMAYLFALQIIGTAAIYIVKTSTLLLFLRVFASVRWLRITVLIFLTLVALFCLISMAVWIALAAEEYDHGDMPPNVSTQSSSTLSEWMVLVAGVFDLCITIPLFLLPIPVVLNLHLDLSKRMKATIMIVVAFVMIGFSFASLICRIEFFENAATDGMWIYDTISFSLISQIYSSVVVNCMPALSTLYSEVHYRNTIFSSILNYFSFRRDRSTTAISGADSVYGTTTSDDAASAHETISTDATLSSSTITGIELDSLADEIPHTSPIRHLARVYPFELDDTAQPSSEDEFYGHVKLPVVTSRAGDVLRILPLTSAHEERIDSVV